ncbi:hypothetical protein M3204_00200 [Mesobacillus subterraneus]|uniref:hypothetical protein n=1 Tax=Mesobacillus subterraneus TaxID=285983 RepID=UPI0020420D35|nr:hypothetical protein [Mesobacillus subterraneus]MCM3662802.1 hypothetical protein [Mesobacillus subterraneus]MCM3683022.1 hypothetical protein [Mesobacillus subterraneus]
MNVTTIIELENREVEKMAGAKLVFTQEQIDTNIVETCVDCFKYEGSEECLETDEAMQKVFITLKEEGLIPEAVEDFSYEMPSCGRLRKDVYEEQDMPQKVILSFVL